MFWSNRSIEFLVTRVKKHCYDVEGRLEYCNQTIITPGYKFIDDVNFNRFMYFLDDDVSKGIYEQLTDAEQQLLALKVLKINEDDFDPR